ncbi:MAG: 50S ribosomal protein L21 [Candidatus Firestonebacteria bacterium]
MKYAIIGAGGKQYKVSEGDVVNIERISTKDKEYNFDKVLMAVDGENVKVGKPTLSDVKVTGEILGEVKGDKIRVFKYRKTEQYRKTIGHRQKYTKVKITKIEIL